MTASDTPSPTRKLLIFSFLTSFLGGLDPVFVLYLDLEGENGCVTCGTGPTGGLLTRQ